MLVADAPYMSASHGGHGPDQVAAAYHLSIGRGLGFYGEAQLGGSPGLAALIAAIRAAGLPYLLALHLAFGCALAFLAYGLRRTGIARGAVLVAFCIALFSPVFDDVQWRSAEPGPVLSVLTIAIAGICLSALVRVASGRFPWLQLLALGLAFGGVALIDVRWSWAAAVAPWLGLLAAGRRFRAQRYASGLLPVWTSVWIAVIPLTIAAAITQGGRSWMDRHYQFPILSESGEGAVPRLIKQIQRLRPFPLDAAGEQDDGSRLIDPRALAVAADVYLDLAPIVAELPTPTADGEDCGVSERCAWSPANLARAWTAVAIDKRVVGSPRELQELCTAAADQIENVCLGGSIPCGQRSLVRGILAELPTLVHLAHPRFHGIPPRALYEPIERSSEAVLYPGIPTYTRLSLLENESPRHHRESVAYWLRNVDVAAAPYHGIEADEPNPRGRSRAWLHYQVSGRHEGRAWNDHVGASAVRLTPSSQRASIRRFLARCTGGASAPLMVLASLVAAWSLLGRRRVPPVFFRTATLAVLGIALITWCSASGDLHTAAVDGRGSSLHGAYVVLLFFAAAWVATMMSGRAPRMPRP